MIFGSKHYETAKLGSQRITVESSEIDQPSLLAESSIVPSLMHLVLSLFRSAPKLFSHFSRTSHQEQH